ELVLETASRQDTRLDQETLFQETDSSFKIAQRPTQQRKREQPGLKKLVLRYLEVCLSGHPQCRMTELLAQRQKLLSVWRRHRWSCRVRASSHSPRKAGLRLVLFHLQRGDEGLLRDLHLPELAHLLLALLLLLEQLALARDVAAIALGDHVLPQRADRFA